MSQCILCLSSSVQGPLFFDTVSVCQELYYLTAYDALVSHLLLSALTTFISTNVFVLASFCRGEEAGGTQLSGAREQWFVGLPVTSFLVRLSLDHQPVNNDPQTYY